MTDALIGRTGYVGSTLARQRDFADAFRSTDIGRIAGQRFGTIVCAGAPGQKWLANKDPEADRAAIDSLIAHLDAAECDAFVLVSTVDVFGDPRGVDEDTPVDETGLHPYGLHRRRLETWARRRFPRCLVARLPGLVGPGLRKNALFDLRHDNGVDRIDPGARFQFYPMVNLWSDLRVALDLGLELVHLTAEPLRIGEIAREVFGRELPGAARPDPVAYDMRSRHAAAFGGHGAYQYSARESLLAIRAYRQSEPARAPAQGGA
jgi:nucleoside-diphosphate-sugar epimerase